MLMTRFEKTLYKANKDPLNLLDTSFGLSTYVPLDLSIQNEEIRKVAISDPFQCQMYIDTILKKKKGKVAYGGYLEKRNLYKDHTGFDNPEGKSRNIHLGIDLWAKEGTEVITPIDGKLHSFKNNAIKGDYGPTMILEHTLENTVFYSLYGHLSVKSLKGLYVGKVFKKGDLLASLGDPSINVHYAPHLHFQIIGDIGTYYGDYPGVCSLEELAYYAKNCPNPNYLLKVDPINTD